MHFGGARGSQDRPGYPRGRSCARPAPTPRQRPRPSGPSGKHPPHRGGGKSRLSYPEARSLELDGSRRGPFCRARALLQGVKRARCPCPGAGGRRRCRTHIYSGSPIYLSRVAAASTSGGEGGRRLAHERAPVRRRRCSPSAIGLPLLLCCLHRRCRHEATRPRAHLSACLLSSWARAVRVRRTCAFRTRLRRARVEAARAPVAAPAPP